MTTSLLRMATACGVAAFCLFISPPVLAEEDADAGISPTAAGESDEATSSQCGGRRRTCPRARARRPRGRDHRRHLLAAPALGRRARDSRRPGVAGVHPHEPRIDARRHARDAAGHRDHELLGRLQPPGHPGPGRLPNEVLEDGLPTQDVSRESPDHGVPVNPLTARRIEVVRGPATLRYGGGASAGVVNAITERGPSPAQGVGERRSLRRHQHGERRPRHVDGARRRPRAGGLARRRHAAPVERLSHSEQQQPQRPERHLRGPRPRSRPEPPGSRTGAGSASPTRASRATTASPNPRMSRSTWTRTATASRATSTTRCPSSVS